MMRSKRVERAVRLVCLMGLLVAGGAGMLHGSLSAEGAGVAGATAAGQMVQAQRAAEDTEQVTLGHAVMPLYGPWRFSVGDSPIDPVTKQPLWAEPGFDDSHWETVSLEPQQGYSTPYWSGAGYVPGWTEKGHPGYWGFAWYRLRVRVADSDASRLAVAGPDAIDDGFEVYSDGRLLGSFGDFSKAHPRVYESQPTMFALPGGRARGGDQTRTVAFRVWMEPSTAVLQTDSGGLHTPPLLGEEEAVKASNQGRWLELLRSQAQILIQIPILLLLAVLALGLAIFDRTDRLYYWVAAVYVSTTISFTMEAMARWTECISLPIVLGLQYAVVGPLITTLWTMVWWVWFKLDRPRWIPRAVVGLAVLGAMIQIVGFELIPGLVPHRVAAVLLSLTFPIGFCSISIILWIVVLGVKQNREGRWAAVPALISAVILTLQTAMAVLKIQPIWSISQIPVSWNTVVGFLMMMAMFVLLVGRMFVSLKRQREQALDIAQAVEVQQVILPETLAPHSGLTIESEYRPARQVGGDFFQVIPNEVDGSLLVVAGDVTGKGLQAGMLVALLVGAVRSTAEVSADPLYVLEALNRRLLGRKSAQATCLAFLITKDGEVTLANAGHIPPYLNGTPVEMEGALPLGMIAEAEFSVMRFRLEAGDKLLVISDGILEATNQDGELFGFERVRTMLDGGAGVKALADAAEAFGQEDDISLVAVTRA